MYTHVAPTGGAAAPQDAGGVHRGDERCGADIIIILSILIILLMILVAIPLLLLMIILIIIHSCRAVAPTGLTQFI